jgi:small subunit ribosomal protein S5
MARTQRDGRRGDGDRQSRDREETEFAEKLVSINRVAKVVKGGRRFGFAALHDITDSYGAGRVIMRAAKPGTGIIAGGPMRAIFEALGVQDVVAKSVGTSNPHNMIKATFEALGHLTSPRAVAARRGKKVAEILGRREAETRESA